MVKLRKLKHAIQYKDGKEWKNWIEDENPDDLQFAWDAMRCGFCVDDLMKLDAQLQAKNRKTA
jgi:hypothetical protein